MNLASSPECFYCVCEEESVEHIFWECEVVHPFLQEVFDWLIKQGLIEIIPDQKSFILGNLQLREIENMVFIVVKYFIYKSRLKTEWLNMKLFILFLKSFYTIEHKIAMQNNMVEAYKRRWRNVLL